MWGQNLETMDNRQSIKPVVNFESLSRVRFDLTGSSSRAVKDAGSPGRDIALDFKLDWRVLTVLRVKLEALTAQVSIYGRHHLLLGNSATQLMP